MAEIIVQGDLRREPAYALGFEAALAGEPLSITATDAFRAGWNAFCDCRAIFERNGFVQARNGAFEKRMSIRGGKL